MGKQGQHQLQGQDSARVLEAAHGMHQHELPYPRSVNERGLSILVGKSVREERIWYVLHVVV